MLLLKPSCECCDKDLPPEDTNVVICSFECTFCLDCAEDRLGGICPNCSGNLVQRPTRASNLLEKYPGSSTRVYKPQGCPQTG